MKNNMKDNQFYFMLLTRREKYGGVKLEVLYAQVLLLLAMCTNVTLQNQDLFFI